MRKRQKSEWMQEEKKIQSPGREMNASSIDGTCSAPFSVDYYLDFLRILLEYEDFVHVITYDDLAWGDDYAFENGYPDEWSRWLKDRDPERLEVLIQHDVDSVPQRSWLIGSHEESLGIRSSYMIFNRRINWRYFKETGELLFTQYNVDDGLLSRLSGKGWSVGYHSNALDQARFDDEVGREIFVRDVNNLRRRFDINYFSAHGGLRSSEGRTNNQLRPPELRELGLRWVHNGASPKFHGQWSDGGLNSQAIDPEKRDLRSFLQQMKRGNRYRILTHPQYYDGAFDGTGMAVSQARWYADISKAYGEGRGDKAWDGVRCHFDALRKGPGKSGFCQRARDRTRRFRSRFVEWMQKP